MKKLTFLAVFGICSASFAQINAPSTPSTKSILLDLMKTTHSKSEWFVCINASIEGLTPEQAQWKDNSENHSILQLVNHLIFWNTEQLAKFKGEKPPKFSGENTETFENADQKSWNEKVKAIDKLMQEWETVIEAADEAKLQKFYTNIANISTHNAYHTGQILYIRKMKGWWNPDKGVK